MTTIVVGGGASGMLCAYFAKKGGNDVILIEQNEKLGKKLYITGVNLSINVFEKSMCYKTNSYIREKI